MDPILYSLESGLPLADLVEAPPVVETAPEPVREAA